jgi:LysR family hydrogen peroxide-inducible transcriptional activator
MAITPHLFSLRQLQYLVAVAEAGSFRRAAEACHVSQPALSAQVAALERGLGVRLFERDRRRVLTTAAGIELLARARRVLVEADDTVADAAGLGDPLAGTLRLGVIPTIAPYLLPALTPALRRQHARLTVLWTEDKTAALVAAIRAGSLDGAVLALEAPLGDLARSVIAKDPFVLVAPPQHALAGGRGRADLAQLRGAQVLLLDEGHCLRDQALAVCSTARAEELDFRATSLSTLVQMVVAGAGVTLLPRLAVPVELRRAQLAVRRLREPAPQRTLALVFRPGSARAPALDAIATALRAAHAKLEPELDRACAG